jgi:hypothetical protein
LHSIITREDLFQKDEEDLEEVPTEGVFVEEEEDQ